MVHGGSLLLDTCAGACGQDLSWAKRWLHHHGALLIKSGWPFPNSWSHPAALRALNASAHAPASRTTTTASTSSPADAEARTPFGDFTDAQGLAMGEIWSGVLGVRRSDEVRLREMASCMRRCACGCGLTFARGWQAIYRDVVRPWRQCALVRDCIAPEGSNKTNHRQDQTALSVLVLSQVRGGERQLQPFSRIAAPCKLGDGAAAPHSPPRPPIPCGKRIQPHIREGYRLFTSTRLRAFAPAHLPLLSADETLPNDILLFQRRGNHPWPYHKHVVANGHTARPPRDPLDALHSTLSNKP